LVNWIENEWLKKISSATLKEKKQLVERDNRTIANGKAVQAARAMQVLLLLQIES
jgi:hypothetical protein